MATTSRTLQKRLLIAVSLAAPLAWSLTLGLTYWRAHHEINELYDTDMVRMAQYVQALADKFPAGHLTEGADTLAGATPALAMPLGAAGLDYVTIAAWPPNGEPIRLDARAAVIPRTDDAEGFVNLTLDNHAWRVFYLDRAETGWRVAVGQREDERSELVIAYVIGQLVPALIGLPILLLLLLLAVQRALRPVRELSIHIESRAPLDPAPISQKHVPAELAPVVGAINRLMKRAAETAEHERRFIADAAHELRTPLAALKAQWEAGRLMADADARRQHDGQVQQGIDRLQRLVDQLLALSRLDRHSRLTFDDSIDWRVVSEQAISDCWVLARDKDIDIECLWPQNEGLALPVSGNTDLLTVLLRNLIDNAIRYSPPSSLVQVVFARNRIEIADEGEGVMASERHRLGDRFYRRPGSQSTGSGLGLSIVRRIADLHGLEVQFDSRHDQEQRPGLRVQLRRKGSTS